MHLDIRIIKYNDNTYIVSDDEIGFCFPIDFRSLQYSDTYDFDINGFELNLHDNVLKHLNRFLGVGMINPIIRSWKLRETSMSAGLLYLNAEDQKPRCLKMLKHGTFERVNVRPLTKDEEKNACELCATDRVVQFICKYCDKKCCQMCLTDPNLCCPYCDIE